MPHKMLDSQIVSVLHDSRLSIEARTADDLARIIKSLEGKM